MKFVLCIVAFVILTAMEGCQSVSSSDAAGHHDRLRLTMYVRDATLAEAYYEVDSKGVLGFGGGLDARLTRTSWTTTLSEAEQRELDSLIEQHRWIGGGFKSTNQPEGFICRIDVRNAQGSSRYNLKGDHPDIAPIREWLHKVSLRRLEPDLQKLPEPGEQPG